MKVKELIEHLQTAHNPDDLVIMARDAEGNNFSPLAGVEVGAYRALTTWYGEGGLRRDQLTQDLIDAGFSEEDVITDGVNACVLWPTWQYGPRQSSGASPQ